jgi:hypothetical protein
MREKKKFAVLKKQQWHLPRQMPSPNAILLTNSFSPAKLQINKGIIAPMSWYGAVMPHLERYNYVVQYF